MRIVDLLGAVIAQNTKFIIVTGGVCSSIGKGVLVSSLGVLLKQAGYSLSLVKWDPYLNVDPGTMSPLVHGEVFVTADGAETDLDLGHYERMVGIELDKQSSMSSGQIFEEIINKERSGDFLGKCIQLVPHAVDATKYRFLNFAIKKKTDFILLEIGGTVGDIEGNVFLEAIRQLKMELGHERVMHCHLSFVPLLAWTGEIKTKPTQHSVIQLKHAGLVPDCLFLRSDSQIDSQAQDKLAVMCGVPRGYIFQVLTYQPIYQLFISLYEQGVGKKIQEHFRLDQVRDSDLSDWRNFIALINKSASRTVTIALVAKYVGSNDPYISVVDALRVAGYYCGVRVNLQVIDAEELEHHPENIEKIMQSIDGIVVPGGFDNRGIEGKILAAQYAREHQVPYFGLCLGLQVMLIEYARNVLKLARANSTELDAKTAHPVVTLLAEQTNVRKKGATMRLGSYPCVVKTGTKAYAAYGKEIVIERHRHRYEVNNNYKKQYEEAGIVFSGVYQEDNLAEIAEIEKHCYMVGTQFHPEFTSSPLRVHPLFKAFIQSCIDRKQMQISD